jgi:RNA polymerase-binding transcription factor DksA
VICQEAQDSRLCICCGDPISAKRLAARPHAKLCLACQALIDQPARVPDHLMVCAGEGDDQARQGRIV